MKKLRIDKIFEINPSNQADRINWVDYVRGFGIIVVIFAHSQIPWNLFRLISFIIVLFPFLSGYLHKPKSLKDLIKKRYPLVLGYYYMGFINYIIWILLVPEEIRKVDNLTYLKNFLLVRTDLFSEIPLGIIPMWYLIYIFIAEITYYIAKKAKFLYAIIIIGFLLRFYIPQPLPFKVDVVLSTLYVFELGRIFRERNLIVKNYIGIISLIIWGIIAQINNGVNWNCDEYGINPILALIGEVSTVLAIVWAMQSIEKITIFKKSLGRLFKRFSDNSLFILGYHILLGSLVIVFLMLIGFNVTEENIKRYWYITFIIMFFSSYISILFIPNKLKALLTTPLINFSKEVKQSKEGKKE
ncbi:MAG: acyltransferase family protein [Fervidobacterium sp.]